LGYSLTTPHQERKTAFQQRLARAFYPAFLSTKFWLRIKTPAGRFASISALELAEPVGSTH
jgi:hypothetical protein